MTSEASFTFTTMPSIVVAAGASAHLGEVSGNRLGSRAFIVTDNGVVAAGLVAPAATALEKAGMVVEIYDRVSADPSYLVVQEAAAAARDFRATGVVGLGGGSSMDVAKLVALLAVGLEKLEDVYGVGLVRGPRLPLVLVPTTAGTGSEVTPISIVTTGEHEKKGVVSPILLPDMAILDADLTLGLPRHITASTGIDAMVHAIEAYTSTNPNANPISRALAREALKLLAENIARAGNDGSNRTARTNMLVGSILAGQAFANSPVAAVHALAYPLGGHFGIPHGLSNALVLPHVLQFNSDACSEAYAELAKIVRPPRHGGRGNIIDWFIDLSASLGVPARLRDVRVTRDALPRLADDAMRQTRLLVNNPRPVTEGDALAIYEAAW